MWSLRCCSGRQLPCCGTWRLSGSPSSWAAEEEVARFFSIVEEFPIRGRRRGPLACTDAGLVLWPLLEWSREPECPVLRLEIPAEAWRWSRIALSAGELASCRMTGATFAPRPFWATVRSIATSRLAAAGGSAAAFDEGRARARVQRHALDSATEWLSARFPEVGLPRAARTDRDLANLGEIAVIGIFGLLAATPRDR